MRKLGRLGIGIVQAGAFLRLENLSVQLPTCPAF